MEDIINRIFDKLENADVSPSANYSMPEYYMHCAMRGREREKRTLFNWISMFTGIDVDTISNIFDERYNNVQNESRNMRRIVRLTESDLHRIVKESVNRAINEVALKGKSGKTYSLHGNDGESWDIVTRLRQKKSGNSNYNTMRDEKNAEEIDTKNHPNRRSLNNAKRVDALLKRTSNASKDIMAANESKLSRIVRESVNRILKEGFTKPSNWKDTPFKGTYEEENGALYMPDDDYGNEGFPYMIVTYNGEEEVNREYVTLPKPNLHAYDDEVPFSLGSNQALIELD